MPVPEPDQKNYGEYLPSNASIGIIKYMTKSITVDGRTTSRKYFSNSNYNLFYVDREGAKVSVVDSTPEYGIGTYSIGDEVQVNEIGLKFKYAAIDDLVVDSENINTYHPLAKDSLNIYTNRKIWSPMGVIDELKPFDGSTETSLYSEDFNILIERKNTFGLPANEGCSTNVIFSGDCSLDVYGKYDPDDPKDPYLEYEVHSSTHQNIDRLSIKDHYDEHIDSYSYPSGFENEINNFELVIYPREDRFLLDTKPVVHIGNVGVSAICYVTWHELGTQLKNHTSNRAAEFKTVVSDGVKKQVVTKSFDVFSGVISVDIDDLKRVEFLLMKATQSDYIFHIGAGIEYDNRFYLGKLKYSSSLEDGDNYKININGQSLSYGVQNPLVDDDSTDWYPA